MRGGWGIYYDFPYTNATILFPSIAVETDFGVAYQNRDPNGIKNPDGSFFQPGQPLPPNQLPGLASNPPNEVASPTLRTPFSRQGSIGFSAEVTPYLFQAGTDAPTWRSRGIPVYGIYPYPIDAEDLTRMHGNDERVSIESLRQGTEMIYRTLVEVAGRR